jgi:RNA polymerase sigma-70 factor, ECF subfamily
MRILEYSEEETLVKTASDGSLDAFNQLVLRYQDMAYNHALTLLGDPVLAEDATQESFIKAFQNIGSFRGGSFRSWLLRIVTNSVYDLLRRFQRHPTLPLFPEDENGEDMESAPWLADPSTSVQDTVEQREFSENIYKLLDELPDAYRSMLNLIDIYELDYTEAAQLLNIPIGTVKSRIARARLKMRAKLKGSLNRASHAHAKADFSLLAKAKLNPR